MAGHGIGGLGNIYASINEASLNRSVGNGRPSPATPTGQRGSPIKVPPGTNIPTTIDGIKYTGHAIDQMQGRGVVPSAVKDVIENGTKTPGYDGAIRYLKDGVEVRVNAEGKVITVITK